MAAYELLTVVREIIPGGWLLTLIEDILFWSVGGIIMFHMMYEMNFGIIRSFAILTIFAGMLLYYKLVGPIVNILLRKPLKNLRIKVKMSLRRHHAVADARREARKQAAAKRAESKKVSSENAQGGNAREKRKRKEETNRN